ncbi:ARPP-1 family domain-containing protein [Methanobacterium congolense]|uniref:ARG and Rhodanese-Phosphatase-superfamily-associated domain-containing protein n=1 Tax=Methanobacterium congolense TaxID=118062 RepID=A0A1D3L2E1_9EURY|nr:DUF6569 family protein [Methanobacterium congolense]SCG85736.1 putative protein [Methanobacterium congolense]
MNFRVILLVSMIFIFAAVFGVMSYSGTDKIEGISLDQAYSQGNVLITQSTYAGTVPHVVTVKNNGNDTVNVEKGELLKSNDSQDLVTAENKEITPQSTANITAYCFEPGQRAYAGTKLESAGNASDAVKEIVANSNPSDVQNATDAQLKIWTIFAGGDLNIYTGEPVALANKQNIQFSKLKKDANTAKSEVMAEFGVTEDKIASLNQTTTNSSSDLSDMWNNFSDWVNGLTGI